MLLYDPAEPEPGAAPFRVVCFAQAPLETEIGLDPFLAEVAWSWLVDALDARGAHYDAASGTATKIISTGFGELAAQGDGAQIELRASWTPLDDDSSPHTWKAGANCSACSRGSRRHPKESACCRSSSARDGRDPAVTPAPAPTSRSTSSTPGTNTSTPSRPSPRAPARSPSTPSAHPDSATRSAPTSSSSTAAVRALPLRSAGDRPIRRAQRRASRDEEWVLHAASQDLACLREVGLDPSRIFDTELAARLAGLPRVGLGTVVEELLGIHLAKEHSAADWSTRPLPQALARLRRARRRTARRPARQASAEMLDERRQDRDRARRSSRRCSHASRSRPRPEPWRRLSGLHTVRGARNLAVARELWQARDAYAREIDTAPGRLVPDASLVAAARSAARDQARPRRAQGVHRPGEPLASSTAGGPRSSAGSPTEDLPAAARAPATRCRRPASGPTAIRRPTRG